MPVKANKAGFRPTDWCSNSELMAFAKLRSSGKASPFRISMCPCDKEIPNSKKYCSLKCKQKYRENQDG